MENLIHVITTLLTLMTTLGSSYDNSKAVKILPYIKAREIHCGDLVITEKALPTDQTTLPAGSNKVYLQTEGGVITVRRLVSGTTSESVITEDVPATVLDPTWANGAAVLTGNKLIRYSKRDNLVTCEIGEVITASATAAVLATTVALPATVRPQTATHFAVPGGNNTAGAILQVVVGTNGIISVGVAANGDTPGNLTAGAPASLRRTTIRWSTTNITV
jgi:hypothetical protein